MPSSTEKVRLCLCLYTFCCQLTDIAWQMLFETFWKDFSSRFSTVIESLTRHRDLVDKEATSIDIAEARAWRARTQEELEDRERDKRIQQLNRTINWFRVDDSFHMPDDDLYRFSKTRLSGTCKWILRDKILVNWRKDDEHHPIIWMKGIPGAGKFSALAIWGETLLIWTYRQNYFICLYYSRPTKGLKALNCILLLRQQFKRQGSLWGYYSEPCYSTHTTKSKSRNTC
jgi:hypothetical protein